MIENQTKVARHKLIFYRDNHIIVTCDACEKTRIVPSFDEDKQPAIKWAYGWLMQEPCEIREGPSEPDTDESSPNQAKLL